jgi:ATP-dependent helicase HrpA
MLALDLGDISDFPFVQPPDNRNITDGIRLLEELAAIEQQDNKTKLTNIGRGLAKFPIDPRLSKMILTAIDLGCVHDVLTIVSALSIQDPRERPMEKQQAADEKHQKFLDKQSDFISLLNLWHFVIDQQKKLSNNQFRKLCQQEYLSYLRIREWQDIYSQLKHSLKELNVSHQSLTLHKPNTDDEKASQHNNVHQAILSGLLSHIGQMEENKEFKGARNSKFYVFPGSGLAKKPPKWLMAAELVETSRLFARMVAKIDVEWVESLAQHLIKRNYSEPHWEKKQGAVMAFEQVSLYGLIIVPKRKVQFKNIEPKTCHDLFILEALVNGDCFLKEDFFIKNQQLIQEIEMIEQKARRKNFLIDEQRMVEFYQQTIPETVVCLATFKKWWKKAKVKNPNALHFTKAFLLNEDDKAVSEKSYPEFWQQNNLKLPLSYHFNPGEVDDGISVLIPVGILNQITNEGFDWLIPAFREELIMAYIKGLPKSLRRNFVPAPNYAQACNAAIEEGKGAVVDAIAKQLLRMTGVRLPEDWWQEIVLPDHLRMNFKVVDEHGKVIKQGRDLIKLQENLQGKVKASIKKVAEKGIERSNIVQWDFANLPKSYEQKTANITIKAFPALVDHKKSVAIELFEHEHDAEQAMLFGVARLVLLNIPSPIKYLQEKLPNKAKLGLYFNSFGSINELLDDCIQAACQYLLMQQPFPHSKAEFNEAKNYVRAEIADCVLSSALKIEQILTARHALLKRMKGNVPLNLIQSHADIKQQLNDLVFKGFVTSVGIAKLSDLLRYIQALDKRLDKLQIDPNQDRLKMIELAKIEQQCHDFIKKQPKAWQISSACTQIKWMLQELRVSFFAQNLGTAYPISVKRITNYLKEQ